MSTRSIVYAALGCIVSFGVVSAGVVLATDEFPPGQLSLGKLRFGQQAKPDRDSIALPGASQNFVSLTPAQVSSANGGKVTLKVNDYCRTFGPLTLSGASRAQLKSSFTNPATGEKFKATFAESALADRFKLSIAVKNTEHGFPSGSFPRAPKPGDPSSLVATLVVGGVGGTWDVLNGARLPFVDPGLQASSEELPDRNGLDLEDVWTFEGTAGDRVSFRIDTVGTAPSGLDLAAELLAPDGETVLKKADDEFDCSIPTACGYGCPEVSSYVLPTSGTYSIVVHDFGNRDDGCDTGGTYTLSITEPPCAGATLVYDRDLDAPSASRAFLHAPASLLD